MKSQKNKKGSARAGKKKKVTKKYKRSSYVKKEQVLDITVSDDSGKKKVNEDADKTNALVDKKTSGAGKFARPIHEADSARTRTAIGFKSGKSKNNKPKK